jgi:hypothetical protein
VFTAPNLAAANLAVGQSITVGDLLRVQSGAHFGAVRTVTNYNPATGEITVSAGLPSLAVGDVIAVGGRPTTINTLDHAFRTAPFGNDIAAEFGDELSLPLIGNFDPPASPTVIGPGTGIAGDYDNNSQVNNADYTAWRGNFGSTTNMLADGNKNSRIDAADYVIWRNNLAASGSSASAMSATSSAMEPDDAAKSAAPVEESIVFAPAASSETRADTSAVSELVSAPAIAAVASLENELVANSSDQPAASPRLAALDAIFAALTSESESAGVVAQPPAVSPASLDDLLLSSIAGYTPDTEPFRSLDWDDERLADDDVADGVFNELAAATAIDLDL